MAREVGFPFRGSRALAVDFVGAVVGVAEEIGEVVPKKSFEGRHAGCEDCDVKFDCGPVERGY